MTNKFHVSAATAVADIHDGATFLADGKEATHYCDRGRDAVNRNATERNRKLGEVALAGFRQIKVNGGL